MKKKPLKKPYMLQSNLLRQYKNIRHYFFDRHDLKNKKYHNLLNSSKTMQQTHSTKVISIGDDDGNNIDADGLVTTESITIGVLTADCLPLLFYNPYINLIGAVHIGWRGLYNGIIFNALKQIADFKGEVKSTIFAVGPHIRECCYTVQKERIQAFQNKYNYGDNIFRVKNNEIFLNLMNILILQLQSQKVQLDNIDDLDICTCCNQNYLSFRRDKNLKKRMSSIIGLVN